MEPIVSQWTPCYLVCSGFLAGPFFMAVLILFVTLFQLSAFDPAIFCRSKSMSPSFVNLRSS